jgi:Tfp pilus assembly protein PilF
VDASGVSGLDFASNTRAFAVTDFDNEGRPDLVLMSRLAPQVRAMRNQCVEARPAVALQLRGTRSNRDAIGARITVNGFTQELTAGSGFLSQHSKRLHFGLNGRDSAEVRIAWPSGTVQILRGLAPGNTWTVIEGDGHPSARPFRDRVEYSLSPLSVRNEAVSRDAWLLEPIPDPGAHKGPAVVTIDGPYLRGEGEELTAAYAIFRRYIFEFRSGFAVPFAVLVDDRARVCKIYCEPPSESVKRADLEMLRAGKSPALPFPGRYFTKPARNYFRLGVAFYWAGYPRRALPYLEEALRARPDNWRALLALAEIQQQLGDENSSLGSFRRALALHPDHAAAMVSIGILLLRKNNEQSAREMFMKAIETDASCAEAANQLGLLAVRARDSDQARRWFERAIEAHPDHSGALNNLGVLFAQLGKYDESLAVFRFGIGRLPDDEPLNVNLARVYAMAGQRDRAVETLSAYLERNPRSLLARRAIEELR